jgi:hypothetical protein
MVEVPMNSGRDLDNAFKQIITAGWNQKSDGDVESPTGHFATIPIAPNELQELKDAVFTYEDEIPEIEPGYYFAQENDQGFLKLWKFNSAFEMNAMYDKFSRDYADWLTEKFVLVCHVCSEPFEDLQDAHDHEATHDLIDEVAWKIKSVGEV